jgi:hypothetical protein
VKLVELEPGATLPSGVLGAHESRILVEGAVDLADEAFEAFSFMTFPRGPERPAMTATAPSTLLAVSWLSGLEPGDVPIEHDWLSVRA